MATPPTNFAAPIHTRMRDDEPTPSSMDASPMARFNRSLARAGGDQDTATDQPGAAIFFMTLLHAATTAHILHFQTNSFAKHMALGKFYKELPELVDELIEAYQGEYGIVTGYPVQSIKVATDPLDFMDELDDFIESNRASVGKDTELQNLIDEVAALVDSTTYKLKFLS